MKLGTKSCKETKIAILRFLRCHYLDLLLLSVIHKRFNLKYPVKPCDGCNLPISRLLIHYLDQCWVSRHAWTPPTLRRGINPSEKSHCGLLALPESPRAGPWASHLYCRGLKLNIQRLEIPELRWYAGKRVIRKVKPRGRIGNCHQMYNSHFGCFGKSRCSWRPRYCAH